MKQNKRAISKAVQTMLSLACAAIFSLTTVWGWAADWPQWKGTLRDNVSPETGLNVDWNAKKPTLLRTSDGLGLGFSDLCFCGEQVYTMGDFDDQTFMIALNRQTSQVVWKTKIGKGGRVSALNGPKATPVADGRFVVGLNQCGIICCLDGQSGKVVWKKNMHDDFHGAIMQRGPNHDNDWGYSESPLLDGDRVVCCPGGKDGTVLALDIATGRVVWRTTDVTDNASYASVAVINTAAGRVGMISTEVSFLGVRLEDGKVLWRLPYDGTSPSLCCDAVHQDGYMVYSYAVKTGFFGALLKDGAEPGAQRTFSLEETGNKQHGMILRDGLVFTTTNRGGLLCFDAKTGTVCWKNRRLRACYTMTSYENRLILRNEKSGELTLVETNGKKYVEWGKIDQPDRSDQQAWSYPIVIDKKLYVRDQDKLFEYDLR